MEKADRIRSKFKNKPIKMVKCASLLYNTNSQSTSEVTSNEESMKLKLRGMQTTLTKNLEFVAGIFVNDL